jgi:hypothetical protein
VSYQATEYVRQLTNLNHVEKAVAFAMACHADAYGCEVRPSMTTTAKESGLQDRETASRVVRRLVEKGVLECLKESKGGQPSIYCFPGMGV